MSPDEIKEIYSQLQKNDIIVYEYLTLPHVLGIGFVNKPPSPADDRLGFVYISTRPWWRKITETDCKVYSTQQGFQSLDYWTKDPEFLEGNRQCYVRAMSFKHLQYLRFREGFKENLDPGDDVLI